MPAEPSAAEKGAATVRHLWSSALTFPIALAVMVLLRRAVGVQKATRLNEWPPGFVAGYLTWLVVTPAAFCAFVLASLVHVNLTGQGPEKHPLTVIGEMAGRLEWALFALQTIVIAPVIEEWMFRGVLLPWLAQRKPVPPATPYTFEPRVRPLLILVVAFVVTLLFTLGTEMASHPDTVRDAFRNDRIRFASAYLIPAAFMALLVPVDYLLPHANRLRRFLRIRSTQDLRAIWASSAMFAAMHASVWPSPIPLMVLALGLGFLYIRTRSLVGPIVVHSMFNAVSATYLMLGGQA
jgi:membrane protease YdiL (CAAX protease family)